METITNVSVHNYQPYGKRAAVSWNAGNARFHVWIEAENEIKVIHDNTLFKNPLLGVDRKSPEHFDTRRLNGTIKKNADIIKRVLRIVERDGLLEKAVAAEQEAEKSRQWENEKAQRLHNIKEAGPDLLDALRAALFRLPLGTDARERADRAIAKATGGA